MVIDAADKAPSKSRPVSERLASLWRTQRHWLLVLIPLALLAIRPIRWSWGSWVATFDSPLIFQPFMPLLAGWLAWEKREELRAIYEEQIFLFGADSPKRRGSLWLVLLGCVTLIVAALAMVAPLAMFGFVLIVIGAVYYLYGGAILRALWQPFLLLLLMIPPPALLLGMVSGLLQGVTSHLVGPALKLFLGDVKTVGNYIFMSSVVFPIGPSLGGPSVALPTMALTLWQAFRKNIRPVNVIILLLIALAVSLLLNLLRTFVIGLISASDQELGKNLIKIPSWLLIALSFFLVTRIARIFTPRPVAAFGEEE